MSYPQIGRERIRGRAADRTIDGMTEFDRPPDRIRLRHRAPVTEVPRDPRALHLRRLYESLPELGEGSYFFLASAGVIHGLPLWGENLDRTHVVHTLGGHGAINDVMHAYTTPLVRPATTTVDGLPCTTLERTAADLMRRLTFGPALATADAALRRGASRGTLLAEVKGGRGCRIATEAALRADPRSESPYESLARAIMLQDGIPLPDLQVDLHDDQGLIGRVDFHWKWKRLVGEFDGAAKLDELLKPGQSRDDVLRARSARDARLWAVRQNVLHWGADDVHDPGRLTASIRRWLGDVHVDHGLCPEAMGHRRGRRRERRRP